MQVGVLGSQAVEAVAPGGHYGKLFAVLLFGRVFPKRLTASDRPTALCLDMYGLSSIVPQPRRLNKASYYVPQRAGAGKSDCPNNTPLQA